MSDQRTYDPEEIHRLLERAMDLQADAFEGAGQAGLTLAELEEVARASGIDPSFVVQAAAELDAPLPPVTHATTTHVFAERVVAGDLTEEVWTDLTVELRRRFESGNEDAQVKEERAGQTRSWQYVDDEEVTTQVHVTPRHGALHLRLSQKVASADSVSESLVWTVIATVILGSMGTQLVDGVLSTIMVFLAAFLVSFPVIYGLDRRWRSSKQRDLDRTADALASLLEGRRDAAPSVGARSFPGADAEAPAPEIDLDVVDQPDEREAPPGASPRRSRS